MGESGGRKKWEGEVKGKGVGQRIEKLCVETGKKTSATKQQQKNKKKTKKKKRPTTKNAKCPCIDWMMTDNDK